MKTFASSLFAGLLEHLNSSLADLADLVLLVQAGSGAEEALSYIEGQYFDERFCTSLSFSRSWVGWSSGWYASIQLGRRAGLAGYSTKCIGGWGFPLRLSFSRLLISRTNVRLSTALLHTSPAAMPAETIALTVGSVGKCRCRFSIRDTMVSIFTEVGMPSSLRHVMSLTDRKAPKSLRVWLGLLLLDGLHCFTNSIINGT